MNLIDQLKSMGVEFTLIEGPQPDLEGVYPDSRFITNPTNHNGFIDDRNALIDACGFLTLWIQDWLNGDRDDTLLKHMEAAYGFPLHAMDVGNIDENGVYHYPEDPDLYPLVEVDVGSSRPLYIYQYAIIAFPLPLGGHIITRMD